ncbi:putative polyol transporter 1 [Punica granatum]|uniref:Polyol transporter 1 n=1 Tax=Punica granatum TaxID=22663 RepID=A0A6P8CIT3_PUNGR|nr:putative polyol transporter 1 [Punica granatum]
MAEHKSVVEDPPAPLSMAGPYGGKVSGKPPKRNTYAIACTILASMTSILIGYDGGVMSGVGDYIQKDLHMSDVELEIINGMVNSMSLLGASMAGRTSDYVGRRYTIVIAGAIFSAGAFLMAFATNFAFLLFGRIVAGIGTGYAFMIAPVYTAEVAPASARGFLTSFPEVFINSGVLLAYISNYGFSKLPSHLGWRFMLGLGAIPSVVLAVGVLAMPESPRWLVMQGRLGEARKVLYRTSDSNQEAKERLADIKEAAGIPPERNDDVVQVVKKRSSGSGVWRELLHPTPAVRHILISAVGIQFFQQASGIDTIVLYSPRIFDKAGLKSKDKKLLATVAVGFSKTVCILISTFYLDRIGRRPILLASVGGMVLSLVALASVLEVVNQHPDGQMTWALVMCIAIVLCFVGSFSMGLGPIAWVYSSEIFPLRLRAQGAAIGVVVNRFTSDINSMTFITLYKAITMSSAFYLFASVAAASWVFFYLLLPETRGRTLEDMEVLFGSYHRWRSVAKKLENKRSEAPNANVPCSNNNISTAGPPEKGQETA